MPGAEPYASGMAVLRAETERQMPDTCRVTRPGEVPQTPELDADGNLLPSNAPVVYEGPCTFSDPGQFAGRQNTPNDESGVPVAQAAKFPHRADLRSGDLIEVTGSTYLPSQVGETYTVFVEEPRSYARYRRWLLKGSSWRVPSTAPTT